MGFSLTLCSSKLEPKLTAADQFEVIQVSTDSVFSLPLMVSPMIGKKKEITVVREIRHQRNWQGNRLYLPSQNYNTICQQQ